MKDMARMIADAHERLCSAEELSPWESGVQEDANGWFAGNCRIHSRDEWESVATGRGAKVEDDMVSDLELSDPEEVALAIAELRECARELVDGVCDPELAAADDQDGQND